MPGRLRFGSASGTAQAGCESLPERLWNTNCTMPGHGKKNRRLDRAIPAHGLGRALHETVRGRHDALPQYRQNAGYNEIVNSYPSFASAGSAATFVVVTVAEVLLAVAIIMGIWVRMSALILSLGILLMFAWGGFGAGELEFVWLGVYVFLIISGGGLYAFDTALTPAKPKK